MIDLNEVLGQAFGFAGGTIAIATGIPQMLRIRKRGNYDGLVLTPWILLLLNYSSYTAYGLLRNSPSIWITNALTFITTALVVTAVKGNTGKIWGLLVFGGLAWSALLVVLPSLVGRIILTILSCSRLLQLAKSWRNRKSPTPTAVSISSLMISVSAMTCWLAYSLFTQDFFITLTTSLVLSITLATALLEKLISNRALELKSTSK